LVGVILSIVAHVAGVFYIGSVATFAFGGPHPPAPDVAEDVSVVPVSSKEWDHNLGSDSSPAPDVRAAEHHKAEPTALPKGQVVDVANGNDQKPADAKYLAEHDNTVAKETRAREQTPFYGKAMPQQTTVTPEPKAKPEQKLKGNQGTGNDDASKAEKPQLAEREIPKTLDQQKVASLERSENGENQARGESAVTNGTSNRLQVRPGSSDQNDHPGSDGKAGVPDATNSPHAAGVAGQAVGAAPNDYLNLPMGDGTFLNTREFKYASFFNRVKQRVGEAWHPNDALRARDPYGRHTSSRTRITVLDVTLNEQGRVVDISVAQSCGLEFLDQEALAAFERAQPFPNPPAGLFDQDHQVRFNFGFHVDNEPGRPSPFQFGRGR
jgi:TonB family protein